MRLFAFRYQSGIKCFPVSIAFRHRVLSGIKCFPVSSHSYSFIRLQIESSGGSKFRFCTLMLPLNLMPAVRVQDAPLIEFAIHACSVSMSVGSRPAVISASTPRRFCTVHVQPLHPTSRIRPAYFFSMFPHCGKMRSAFKVCCR